MTANEKRALEQMEDKAMEIAKEVLISGRSESFAAMAVREKFRCPPIDPAVIVQCAVIELQQDDLEQLDEVLPRKLLQCGFAVD